MQVNRVWGWNTREMEVILSVFFFQFLALHIFFPFFPLILPAKNNKKPQLFFRNSLSSNNIKATWYAVYSFISRCARTLSYVLFLFSKKTDWSSILDVRHRVFELFRSRFCFVVGAAWDSEKVRGLAWLRFRVNTKIGSSQRFADLFGVMMVGDNYFKTNSWDDEIEMKWNPLGIENLCLIELIHKSVFPRSISVETLPLKVLSSIFEGVDLPWRNFQVFTFLQNNIHEKSFC